MAAGTRVDMDECTRAMKRVRYYIIMKGDVNQYRLVLHTKIFPSFMFAYHWFYNASAIFSKY